MLAIKFLVLCDETMKLKWRIAKILFAPLLILQGLWVRKKTPILPEPKNKTSGVIGNGKGLKLLLLGDSSAAGVGAEHPKQTLLAQLLNNLSPQFQVHFQMMAETGRNTAEMIKVLEAEPPGQLDYVVTALGVNDVTSQVSKPRWLKQQKRLIQLVKKSDPKLIIISGLPPVGDFPALPWPLNRVLGGCADDFDQELEQLCASENGVSFHSLRNYPAAADCASDGFHPGSKTYEIWGRKLSAEIIKNINHAILDRQNSIN